MFKKFIRQGMERTVSIERLIVNNEYLIETGAMLLLLFFAFFYNFFFITITLKVNAVLYHLITRFCSCTDGVCGVGAVLVGKERRSLGEHVLLGARVGRRSPIHSAGRLDWTTQRSHWTSVCVQLERSAAGGWYCTTTVAVRRDRRPILAALNCLQSTHSDEDSF